MDNTQAPIPTVKKFPVGISVAVIAAIVLAGGAFAYWKYGKTTATPTPTTNQNANIAATNTPAKTNPFTIPTAQASKFATFEEPTVTVEPKVPAVTLTADLKGVTNLSSLALADPVKAALAKHGFAVTPSWYAEFFSVYERHRYNYIPSYISADSALHNYHLLFDHLLKKTEESYLIPRLTSLNAKALEAARADYTALQGTDWENAAKRSLGFFAVASKLMDSSVTLPDTVRTEAQQELDRIAQHTEIKDAAVMSIGEVAGQKIETPQGTLSLELLKEDYSQYVPRGHYDKTDALKAYFKTMMWYGRMTFRLKTPDEVRSAVLITRLLQDQNIRKDWEAIYEPTTFFVGKSDDIGYTDFATILTAAYGENPTAQQLTDAAKFATFQAQAAKLDPPQINSIPVFAAGLQPNREEEIKGFRFMGQRFTIDASIFQRLVCREVGNKSGTMQCPTADSRMLPNGLDVPAAFGSKAAEDILTSLGEKQYKQYPENLKAMQEYVSKLSPNVLTQNLYWSWLYTLQPLLQKPTAGYPTYMQNDAWTNKQLQTYLGSWAELKHDTILYAKQTYAELGGGGDDIAKYDDRGYVEPVPVVFARLAALSKMTREGLQLRSIISSGMVTELQNFESLASQLQAIATKELNNVSRTKAEYELIRSYGGQLEHLWNEVHADEITASDVDAGTWLQQNPGAIIADVATDPNGKVLEVGTGRVNTIYAVVNVEGVTKVAVGGVYSYYEFPHPLTNRLTDEAWHTMLDEGKAPAQPSWTDVFTVRQ